MVKISNIYYDKQRKTWYFRAYLGLDENGKRIQKTKRGFTSQRDAKLGYDKFMLAYGYNQPLSAKLSSASQLTFEEFYRVRFVKWYERQVKRQTFENAQFIFEKRLRYFYHLRIRDIKSEDVEEWMYELSQTSSKNSEKSEILQPLSKSYINRLRGHLKIVMERAVKEGLIEKNPVEEVSTLSLENKKVEFWEISDFKKVMSVIPDNNLQNKHRKIIFEMLFYTGVRIGELEALPWSNVNFEKRLITVEKTLVYNGKNDWYFSTPKTKHSFRTIGIGEVLAAKLKEWHDLQKMIGNFEYVSQIDGTFTPPYSFANWLKEAAILAGVIPIKLHGLRHSHVALLVEQNIQPLAIQERLGHSNIQITLGTYGHLYAKSDQILVSVLDNLQID